MKKFELIFKSILGLLFLLCLMGLALFLPFGGLDYLPAWYYLIVFTVSVLWITLYLFIFDKKLLESRLVAGPIGEKRKFQKLIQSFASLSFIGIFILSAFDYKNKWSNLPLELSYISDIICALAFVFIFYVFKQNTFLSATIEVKENQKVISTGLYSIIRHPMYSGAFILLFFTPLALGSLWALIPVLLLFAVIFYRAKDEEEQLKQDLQGYQEYCKKVKYRFIPFIF